MNVEELRLILETVSGVTDGAMVVAILWAAKGYFTFTVGMGVLVFALVKAVTLLQRLINGIGVNQQIMDELETYGGLNRSERNKAMLWLRKGKEAESS